MKLAESVRIAIGTLPLGLFAAFGQVTPALADSISDKTAQKQAEIPNCTHKIGTLAVREPQNNWWQPLGLESPEALLKVFVMKSGCFTLLDRGQGFAMAQQERALASGGELQGGSNVGMGQVKAADYILVPDIVSKNGNASGTNVGGILGGFLGGGVGALVSSINISSKTADVVLTVTNVRTSEQQAMEEGHGSKTDVGIGFGGGWGGWGGFGGAGISNYQNMARAGRLYTTASDKSKVVRPLDAGMMLYPTGNKDGVWWEVKDELGNQGWVSSLSIALAK